MDSSRGKQLLLAQPVPAPPCELRRSAVTERTNSALSKVLAGHLRTLARRRCTVCSTSRPRLPTPANSTGFQELLK